MNKSPNNCKKHVSWELVVKLIEQVISFFNIIIIISIMRAFRHNRKIYLEMHFTMFTKTRDKSPTHEIT